MKKNPFAFFATALLLTTVIAVGPSCKEQEKVKAASQNRTDRQTLPEPAKQKETTESVQHGVDSLSQQKVREKQTEIIQEAISAIRETENALDALDKNKPKEALAALEKATGKLELILVREPTLALAPMDIDVSTRDVLMNLQSIKKMRDKAEDLLEDGEVQKTRQLIRNLGSEIVIRVTNLPLATYPDAIKAVTPLIDQGKIEQAKAALIGALNTMVVTDHIIPLPVLRAETMLKDAESLAERKDRSAESDDSLAMLLENARYQLKMAEALGYGDKKDYKTFFAQLDEIKKKTEKGKSGTGFFDKIKRSMVAMKEKVFK